MMTPKKIGGWNDEKKIVGRDDDTQKVDWNDDTKNDTKHSW